jgi:homoserine kinase
MKDRLHQPYRAALIPGMSTILEQAVEHGALGVALSGAGPTLIAFVEDNNELPNYNSEIIAANDSSDKTPLEQFLLNTLKQEGIDAKTLWLSPCVHGPQITVEDVSEQFAIPLPDRIKGDVKV